MKKRTFLRGWMVLLVFVAGTVSAAMGQIIYVDADAPGSNNGSSWEDAYNYLQNALSVSSSGDEIRIAQGVYKPDQGANQTPGNRLATFQLINGVSLVGGFAGFGEIDPDARDIELYKTILSGDLKGDDVEVADPCDLLRHPSRSENSCHVLSNETEGIVVLDGFIVTGGNANYGRNKHRWGGGLLNISGSPVIINCRFTNNSASSIGGAMVMRVGTVVNCIFNHNCVGGYGGAVWSDYGSGITISNCTVVGNSSEYYGGGVYLILAVSAYSALENLHTQNITGALDSKKAVINCIFRANRDEDGMDEFAQIDTGPRDFYRNVIAFSCIQGWTGGGEGNINADPLFVNASSGNYRLSYGSLCIDAGTNNPPGGLPETDINGKPRIKNEIVDMGAYEFGPDWYVDCINGDDNNNGLSPETAFATIQKGIDSAEDGEMVTVYPGIYNETIDFLGKAITVKSTEDAPILQAQGYFAVLFCSGEGPDSILRNFVIENSFMAIYIENGSPAISNVTIADNGFGIAAYTGSVPYISNSIFWNNVFGDLFGCQATYSCVQNGCAGPGNLDIDPRFADPENGDYHLQSKHGRYWPVYDIWVLDEVFSPCIDGGDPNDDYSNERMPNGGRINMGAFGGTAYASKKEMRWLHSDANKDGWVNMIDFAMIALDWLKYKPGTSNLPPEVSISSWEWNSGIIEIEADAWDPDGSVEWVEFLADGDVIGEDNNGADGWTTEWQVPHGGDYRLTAEATDDDGETATSPAVEITINIR